MDIQSKLNAVGQERQKLFEKSEMYHIGFLDGYEQALKETAKELQSEAEQKPTSPDLDS